MSLKKELVKVIPCFKEKRLTHFESNIKPGDVLSYQKSNAPESVFLPKRVTVLSEGPFHFLVDAGKYKVSINKSSVYCRDSILYLLN